MMSPKPRLCHHPFWSFYLPSWLPPQQWSSCMFYLYYLFVLFRTSASPWRCTEHVDFIYYILQGLFVVCLQNGPGCLRKRKGGWDRRAERDLDERNWKRCSSHHLCSMTHISSSCHLLISCCPCLSSSINMQNSLVIHFYPSNCK